MPKFLHPEEVQLSNGISVILQHYDGPVAATYWWNKVGSADETPPEAGFAHFLEHMLFKDAAAKETGKASTGKTAGAIEALGGDINAYTSFDQTVYHVTCAEQHWERVLDVFGTMAKPQRFLKKDFENEREVILEELRKNEDSPDRQLYQALFSSTFSKHPYGRPVIGYVKTLKAATVSTLERFYRRMYVSGNMGIVLVGPIGDEKSARRRSLMRILEKRFGASVIARKPAFVATRRAEPPVRPKPAFVKRGFDVKTPSLAYAFRVPELMHDDIPTLDVISGVLGMGEVSRLYQRLFYKSAIATDVGASLYAPRDPGMFYLHAETSDTDKLAPLTQEMFEEVARIRDGDVTEEELSRVIVNAESERLYATQTADGMAGRLGFLRFVLGDLSFDEEYLRKLRDVDGERVREVAARYLDFKRMSGAVMLPKELHKGFDLEPVVKSAERFFKAPETAKAAKTRKALRSPQKDKMPVEYIERPSGISVAYFERPQSHVASVHASVIGGLRLELSDPVTTSENDWGSGYLMAQTWSKGTPYRDARAISSLTEGLASSFDGFSGRNSVGLELTGLSRDWNVLSELFTEVLFEPAFTDEEVAHSRRVAEDAIRSVEDHTAQLCMKNFLATLYERHPYGRLSHGSLESIADIDGARLRAFHRKWVRPERLVISVSGNVKRRDLNAWLDAMDERAGKVIQAGQPDLPSQLPDESELKAPRWFEKHLGREQVHIVIGGLGATVHTPDRYALRLVQTILGGQSGRLFIELREKKSLAYTVAPISFEGLEKGYVGTYIGCSPGKREEAVKGMREVLEKLAAKGPSPKELQRAKEFYLGRRAMDLQSDHALASHYGLLRLYGIEPLDGQALKKVLDKITARDIQNVMRKYLIEPHMVTAVVG